MRTATSKTALLLAVSFLSLAGCERELRPVIEAGFETEAQVTLFNATNDVLPMRTQTLRRQFQIDCDLVGEDPGRFIKDAHLSNPLRRFLFSGQEVSLDTAGDFSDGRREQNRCRYSFVSLDDERLPSMAVSWSPDLPMRGYFSDVDLPPEVPPEAPSLIADADYSASPQSAVRAWRDRPCDGNLSFCSPNQQAAALAPPQGAEYYWTALGDQFQLQTWEESILDELPLERSSESCSIGARRLSWDGVGNRRFEILSVAPRDLDEENTGNCFDVGLRNISDGTESAWGFCGSERLSRRLNPDDVRGALFAEFFTEVRPQFPNAYENLSIDLEWVDEENEIFQVETIELIRGRRIPEHIGLTWDTTPSLQCSTLRELEECPQVVLPIVLSIDTNVGTLEGRAGETIALNPSAERRLEILRAMHRAVVDTNCVSGELGPGRIGHIGPYMELVYFAGVTVIGL